MGDYKKTKYPGIMRYVGTKEESYVIDFYANGKRHREKIDGGLTKAREELEKRRKAGRLGSFVSQSRKRKYSMEDLIEKYKEERAGNEYFENAERYCLDMIGNHFQGRKLITISPDDILHFHKDRQAVLKKDGTLRTNASVNREVALLRHLLNSALFYEWLEVNPFDKFKREQNRAKKKVFLEEPKRDRIVKPEELDKILPHCQPYLRNITLGLLLTGLRVRDLLRLHRDDIDWEAQAITFLEKKKHNKKGRKPLTEDFANLLKSIPPSESGFIFVGANGEPIKNPPRGFRRMLKKAGITDLRLRDLRRSHGTALMRKGVPLPVIQKDLGHTKLSTTEIYLHVDREQEREELKKLDGYFVSDLKPYGEKMVRNRAETENPLTGEGVANA